MSSEKIKENIIKEINKLPEESLKEINDFVSFILAKSIFNRKKRSYHHVPSRQGEILKQSKELDPGKDPLLKIIGIVDVEPFANKIDKELYGDII
ncbi:MAG: hypothetical protein ACYDA4_17005 [Ignavibacteriaceae bacterium]